MSEDSERDAGAGADVDEVMGELRVALPGAEVLFAFLLSLPFSNGFAKLDDSQRGAYFVAFAFSALAATLLIAPSAMRQIRRSAPAGELVLLFRRLALAGLAALAIAVVTGSYVVAELVVGTTAARAFALALALVVIGSWWLLPLYKRRRRGATG